MALYAIGDLHLCLGAPKPMDIFGGNWVGYMDKLRRGIEKIHTEDTTVLMGDLSWAMNLEQAKPDFAWINDIPGKKIILKGNHDYWWTTASKFYRFCNQCGFSNMEILNNNSYQYENWAICGTRGWFFEENRSGVHDKKVFQRELIRLETSLKSAGNQSKLVFLHYPPKYTGYECPEILALLKKYEVHHCYYGHLHGASHKLAVQGLWDGINFKLLSADYINFDPVCIIP